MELSQEEIKLFKELGYGTLLPHVEVLPLYRIAVETAFLKNQQGPAIEALRRGAKAIFLDARPYRLTKEFDKLVEF